MAKEKLPRITSDGKKLVSVADGIVWDGLDARKSAVPGGLNHARFSFSYSLFASVKTGSSASASFHNMKKSS